MGHEVDEALLMPLFWEAPMALCGSLHKFSGLLLTTPLGLGFILGHWHDAASAFSKLTCTCRHADSGCM